MNEYWLSTTEGYIRLSEIYKFAIYKYGIIYELKAVLKDTKTSVIICKNTDVDALQVISKALITGNSALLFKFDSSSEKNVIKELLDKIDELTEMIKYMPGGPVFLQARSHFVENSVASNSSVSTELNQDKQ